MSNKDKKGKKHASDETLLKIVQLREEGLSGSKIAKQVPLHRATINRFLAREIHQDFWEQYDAKPIARGTIVRPHKVRATMPEDKKVFLFTSAQNNTHVHKQFWGTLLQVAKHRQASLHVGTFIYNKNGFQNGVKNDKSKLKNRDDVWFDPIIKDYITDQSIRVVDGLVWCGELNILPTAINPLNSWQPYTGKESSIIPHAKLNMLSVPTHKNDPAKLMYTTGACTQLNYIQKTSGQKAQFHHVFSALLVEVDKDGTWFARQLTADSRTGHVQDLDVVYTPDGWTTGHRVEAINWGDIHTEKLDPIAGAVSFGVTMKSEGSIPQKVDVRNMLDELKPRFCFYHDVYDFKVRNHHSRKNPLFKLQMMYQGTEEVEFGVKQVAALLGHVERDFCQSIVVNSNHDAALTRWATEADWKDDPINAEYLLACQLKLTRALKAGDGNFCLFEDSIREHKKLGHTRFLRLDEPFQICGENGIECGYHGHTGNNGARGSTQSYRVAGTRFNIGHQHSPNIRDGVYVAGVTGKMDMGYNQGMGSWSHSHIITYPSSKRAMVTITNGRYRASHHFIDGEWVKI